MDEHLPVFFKFDTIISCLILQCLIIVFCYGSAFCYVTEFVPSVYISEDYTDNYDQTEFDKIEEFYTTYGVDLSLGFYQQTSQLLFRYNPEYKDYKNYDENDGLEHNGSIDGKFLPNEKSVLNFNLNYDGHSDNSKNSGRSDSEGISGNGQESWKHSASIDASYEINKYTDSTLGANYSNSYSRQRRTNEWNESKNYSLTAGTSHQFGENDSVGFDYTYSMTDYVGPDSDDYDEHNPSLFLNYRFSPKFGLNSNLSYEYTVYDLSDKKSETWSGDCSLIRNLTKHFDLYAKYEHTYTKEESRDHTVYNPSVGFDWDVDEDSGVSLGIGYMIQKWGNSDTSEGLFADADVFKTFNFSRHGAFTITASSGYDATSEDAASLGFRIYYQAGAMLSYQVARHISTRLTSGYTRDKFDDPEINRIDNTIEYGAGISWSPYRFINVDLKYNYEDYSSDDETIEDFTENRGTILVTLYPTGPSRMSSSSTVDRVSIEKEIFSSIDSYYK